MDNITVDLSTDMIHETLIALAQREFMLQRELANPGTLAVVREIARRQLSRVVGAIAGLEDALDGAQRKAAAGPYIRFERNVR